ncbi:MAG: thioredoxin-related protein [Crocinitomicaceae bacterium]|jgi:thioredoxin-related protein
MKNIKFSPILILAMIMLSSMTFAKGINFQDLTLKEGIAKAKKENKKLFIDVYATWCGPCKYLSKNIFTDQDLGGFINEHFIAIKLDGEQPDGESLMIDFDLNSYPTMLFLDSDRSFLKKIVGAVEANVILARANDVIYPEESDLYKFQSKYDAGARDRELMSGLTRARMDDDLDADQLVTEYLELYPKLDLYEENDFMMFYMGVNELDNEHMIFFLDNIYDFVKAYEGAVFDKLGMIFYQVVNEAVENQDRASISKRLDDLYEPYAEAFGEDAMKKSELLEAMQDGYDEETADE